MGRILHGVVIAHLKIGSVLARPHFTRLRRERICHVLFGFAAAGERFVDLDDQSGDLFQPGEVRVPEDQRKECTGAGDESIHLFVFGALAIEKQLVLFEEEVAEFAEEFPAFRCYWLRRH